ncbi:MAG: hypothetical protein HW413_65 [Thermoleophilia bacterium]|nr:hypothetical protein [Thermoleophilia bacterium]
MHKAASRGFVKRVLPLVLAVPLIVVPAVAYLVLSTASHGGGLPVAQGSSGGTLHPLAGDFQPSEITLDDCDGDSACLEQAFGNLSFREGPRAALVVFESRIAVEPEVEKNCHRIVHRIGSAALERFDGNIARTFAAGAPTCVSGYYHGILERAFLGVSSKAELGRIARKLCVGGGLRRRGFLDYQCRHGLGHGLMIQTGYDLPLALSFCASLGTGWDHRACAGGAFMENLDTRFGFRSAWLDDDDPLYPCERVRARDKHSCYLRASWRIHILGGGDFRKTVADCAQLGVWMQTCFRGFGRDVAEVARYAPGKTLRLCRLAGARQGDCLMGAARTIANASGPRGIRPASALCERAPRSTRAACFSGVGLVLGMLQPTNSSRRAACSRLTPRYVEACISAALAEVDPSGRDAWG